ncbi:DUF6089 family protein [Polaribacter tangerinus]|uniref:type IX secretion system protein PorG n=1 Tax=Polaribacter tangerinus TaxID=1920034 RepID=UPI000B4B9172|nr:DUF6089 family protein [Polaribacter tangerinus]
MKNTILAIIFISFSYVLQAQVYEIGVTFGGTNFIGDVGSTQYLNPNTAAGAVFFKYNWNPRIAFKGTYSFLPIRGNNKNSDRVLPPINGINVADYSFKNTINEVALGMEFNFYEYDISSSNKSWTPYILIELAAFNYTTTQREVSPNNYIYTNKTSFAVPFGLGFKSKLIGDFAFAIETKFRYTFEDDLDFSTDKIPSLNFGGTGNDWYVFTGFSLIYTFGRPACYTKGL